MRYGYGIKGDIPAMSGKNRESLVGYRPGRLGEGRNRIHRAATTCNINTVNIHPGTKKRRMLCIVVSRLPALFERLMLLDYQIRLDLASGVVSMDVNEWVITWVLGRKKEYL